MRATYRDANVVETRSFFDSVARQFATLTRLVAALFRSDSGDGQVSRSHHRYRRASLTAVASLLSLGASSLVGLFSVPLVAGYLGNEMYGVWLTLNSTLAWFALASFGAPQGLHNALAACAAKNDEQTARGLVSSAFAGSLVVATVLIVAAGVAISIINWSLVFNLPPTMQGHAPVAAIGIAMLVTILNVPLNTFRVVYIAHQQGYLASVFDAIRVLLSLAMLLLAVHMGFGLAGVVLAIYGTGLFVSLASILWMFLRQFPQLRPSTRMVRFASLRAIARTSASVFGISVIVLLISTAGNMILTQTSGPSEVPSFALPAMIFALSRGIGSSVSGSPGAAYAEAAARDEWEWIICARRRIRVVVGTVMISFALGMAVAGPHIIDLWSRGHVHTDRIVIVLLGIHSCLWVTLGGEANVINNLDMAHRLVRPALVEGLLFLLLGIPLAVKYTGAGVAAATLIAFLCTNAWYVPYQVTVTIREGIRKHEAARTCV